MIEKKKTDCNKLLILIAFIVVISLPIYLYQYKFGTTLSNERDIWGQFGSYISGIYAPFFSFLTLYLLYLQNKTQVKMDNYQREHNDANQLRKDAEFHLELVHEILSVENPSDKLSIKNTLYYFSNNTRNNLPTFQVYDLGSSEQHITSLSPRLFDAWLGYCGSLKSLKTYENTSFKHHYISVKKLPISLLSYELCFCLNKYCLLRLKDKNQPDLEAVFDEF